MFLKEKINEGKQKIVNFYHEHDEMVDCLIGAFIGGLIVGHMWAVDHDKTYQKGYKDGGGKLLDHFYDEAVMHGGRYEEKFRHKSGRRLGITADVLPERRDIHDYNRY